MTTLFLFVKNLFPFRRYKVFVKNCENDIIISLINRNKCGICPTCGKHCRNVETNYSRTVRDLDISGKKCFIEFSQKKIRCSCSYRGLEKLDFVSKSKRITKRMEQYVSSLCDKMSLKDVSKIVRLNWKTVKDIDYESIKLLLPDIAKLKFYRIAIDEIAIMKGHKYLTIIRDYDTGIVIKIVFKRSYEIVSKALLSIGLKRLKQIKYVSIDMWDPYIKAVKEHCINAEIVFDKFHIVKKVNEALDKVRKKEFAKANSEERINMKHKRFIILKRESNLKKEQKEELNQLMKSNDKLYKAYILKEQILSIFADTKSTFEQIKDRIQQWFKNILNNNIEEYNSVVKTMKHYFYGILNYFRYGMTNAIAEGFNTKINIIKRRAFGIRDIKYFMLKIYQSSLRRLA